MVARDGALPPDVRDDVLLLVTELVTNAVRHAGVGPEDSLQVEVWRWARRVRVQVADPGPGITQRTPLNALSDAGGWGLVLVDRIAARWGAQSGPSYNRVWFEIDY